MAEDEDNRSKHKRKWGWPDKRTGPMPLLTRREASVEPLQRTGPLPAAEDSEDFEEVTILDATHEVEDYETLEIIAASGPSGTDAPDLRDSQPDFTTNRYAFAGSQPKIIASGDYAAVTGEVDFLGEATDETLDVPPSALTPLDVTDHVDRASRADAGIDPRDRRQHPRILTEHSVRFFARSQEAARSATLGDLSQCGMFVRSGVLPRVGEIIACGFLLDEQTVLVKGTVTRTCDDMGFSARGFGLRFTEVSDQSQALIEDIIDQESMFSGDHSFGGNTPGTIPSWLPMDPLI